MPSGSWTYGGEATEGALLLKNITTPTYWKAGVGRIFYEPSAAEGSADKLTLDSAEYDGEISANEAKGLDVTVKGSNQIGVIANQNGNLTLTGDGSLTANQVVTQQGNSITNNIADLNTVLVQFGDNKNTYKVYGDAELPRNCLPLTEGDTESYYDAVLTIQQGATLTIPEGTKLRIRKLDCLKNEGGTIVNNGTVILGGEAATNANAETVKALGLSGSGMVQVMAGNGEITAAYTNSGEERPTPAGELDLSNTTTADDTHWDSKGYKWTDVVKDSSNNVIGGTLTLAEGFEANKVTLPDGDVKIVTEGDSLIGTLTTKKAVSNLTPNIKLTFSGPGKLTLEKRLGLDGNHSDIIISEGAHVIAKQGLTSGDSGGHSSVTVNGTLEAKYYENGSYKYPAVYTGKVAVGDKGVLEVSGVEGVSLNGNKGEPAGLNAMFTVTGNGRFTANCSGYNIRVGTSTADFPEGTDAKKVINLGPEYMPDDCEARFNEGKTAINLIRKSTNEVYSGALTIHKNHTWKTTWAHNTTTHWHPCEFAGCTEKQPGSEAAHFYRSCVCTICGYQAPAGTPDSDSGGSGGSGGGGSSGGSSGSSSYTVTVEKAEHGRVASNRAMASEGSTVTLTVTPDSGYALDTLTVTDSRGNEISLTDRGDGKYAFTMPGRAVTVKAAFISSACTGGADCPSRAFSDLDTGKWYHEATDFVLQNGLMGGYGNGKFGPDDTLTRAQFAQILYNKEGRPAVNYLLRYNDVADGAWYTEAIRWATSQGIVSGYSDRMFGPNDNITREQLAVMLWRYAGSPAAAGKELHFTDADRASGWALEALRWAVENGVINGKGGGILDPQGLATRAQVAQMLMNFLKNK